ncbi:Fc receptor-like protein 3 [Leptodactylus fuscus]|uniref:Fc receptor-like protein 3 n=1 Tax=Leptodactylus fuscus TaxID=238119 RepID=UPI003F4F25EB
MSEAAPLTYLELDPDWRTIFEGDKITMTCKVLHSTKLEDFYWYKDGRPLDAHQKTFTIPSAKKEHDGEYRCRTSSSSRSDGVQVTVSNDWVILQVPSYILEGDKLTLKCRGWDIFFSSKEVIYKGDHVIRNIGYPVDNTRTGMYKCSKTRLLTDHTSMEIYVPVHELFSVPALKQASPLLSEGDELTLTCDTTLTPRRRPTVLQFAFYRNGQTVQEFSTNNRYRVQSTLGDSGRYTCTVRTLLGTVRKTSNAVVIQIQEVLKTPVMNIFPSSPIRKGVPMVLQCETTSKTGGLLYSFLKDQKTIIDYTKENNYLIPKAGEDHSGNYQCSAKTENNKVVKYSEVLNVVVKIGAGQLRLTLLPDKVVVGDEMTLRCESSEGFFPTQFRFYHNGTLLRNVNNYQKRSVEIRHIIKSVTMTGPYYCDCPNSVSSKAWKSEEVSLFIMDPVANVSITMDKDDEDFVFGEPLTLTCSLQHGTSPSFLWLHDEEVVEQDSTFYQLTDNQKRLHIDSLQIHHIGAYRCKASNTLPPNRVFSIVSAPKDINVVEPITAEGNNLFIALGVVLLTILIAVLSYMYRDKMAPLFRLCALLQPKTDRAKGQARITQTPTSNTRGSLSDIVQEDYSNIPSRGLAVCEDVCYAYIDTNRTQEASAHPSKANVSIYKTDDVQRILDPEIESLEEEEEELSVIYSAVKLSPTSNPRTTRETPNGTNLYQNFEAKRPKKACARNVP